VAQVRLTKNNKRLLGLVRKKYKERKATTTALANQLLAVTLYQLLPEAYESDMKQFTEGLTPQPPYFKVFSQVPLSQLRKP